MYDCLIVSLTKRIMINQCLSYQICLVFNLISLQQSIVSALHFISEVLFQTVSSQSSKGKGSSFSGICLNYDNYKLSFINEVCIF